MSKLDVEPAEYINFDLFPTAVRKGSLDAPSEGEQFRTIVTNNYLYVIVDAVGGPVLHIKEPLESFEGSTREGYRVNDYYINKAENCGCGTGLRGIHPFMGVPFSAQLKGARTH